MITVKQTETGYVVDNTLHVPNDPRNRHYQEIQEWIAAGNTPEPYVAPTNVEKWTFSSNDYFDRFTQAEQLSIVAATNNDIEVKIFYDRMWGSDFIDLRDPRTTLGIDLLIAKELLDASRKVELLAPEVISE